MQVGQLIYWVYPAKEPGKTYYQLGYVKQVFDEMFLVRFQDKKVRSFSYQELEQDNENGEYTTLLKENGNPVFAKKNIFGKYILPPMK